MNLLLFNRPHRNNLIRISEKEQIEFIFQEYEKSTSKPESLEEGLKGVQKHKESIESILKGGTI